MPEPLPGFPFSPLECRRGTTGLIADEQLILGQHAGSNWNVKLTNTIGFERTRRKSDCPLFRENKWICCCHLDHFSFLSHLMFIISWCRTFLLFNSPNLPSGPSNGLWNCTDPLVVCLGSLPDPSPKHAFKRCRWRIASSRPGLGYFISGTAGTWRNIMPRPCQARAMHVAFLLRGSRIHIFFTVPLISMFWKRCANPFLFRFLKLPHLEIYAEPPFNQSVNLLCITVSHFFSSRFSWFFLLFSNHQTMGRVLFRDQVKGQTQENLFNTLKLNSAFFAETNTIDRNRGFLSWQRPGGVGDGGCLFIFAASWNRLSPSCHPGPPKKFFGLFWIINFPKILEKDFFKKRQKTLL